MYINLQVFFAHHFVRFEKKSVCKSKNKKQKTIDTHKEYMQKKCTENGTSRRDIKQTAPFVCLLVFPPSGELFDYNCTLCRHPFSYLLVAQLRLAVVAQSGQLATSVVLVVHIVGHILKILQMRTNHHIAQRNKITMLQILDWKKNHTL
jgi:hypothetical protein